MSSAPFVLIAASLLVGAEPAEPDPAALVAKLGAADPAERAAAAEALTALGRQALPALRQAHTAPDRDLRDRASTLWDTIQRDLLTRPSLVRLDFRDRSLTDAIDDLRRQTGLSLRVSQTGREERVNVREPAPVPFWQAVERLGLTGARFDNANPRGAGFPNLELSDNPEWAFTSSSGPFRIALMGLHLHRDRSLISGPWVRIDRIGQRINVPRNDPATAAGDEVITLFGGLELKVEPRMWFTQEAPARLTKASDELGQSLVLDPDSGERATRLNDGAHFSFHAGSGVTQVRTEFRLRLPDRAGRRARLHGVVPLMLHLRRPDPMLVIPLAGAAGQTFRCDDAEFTIRSVSDSPTITSVAMTVRLNVDKADLPASPDPQLVTTRLQLLGAHQLELTDAEGTVLVDHAGSGGGGGATPQIYQWTISNFRNGRATHLRYFGMLRARYDAAFEFQDVPLP